MKMFGDDKNRMIGLPYGEKNYDNALSRFHPLPERHGRTDRRTGGQTDRIAISITRVDKNRPVGLTVREMLINLLKSPVLQWNTIRIYDTIRYDTVYF